MGWECFGGGVLASGKLCRTRGSFEFMGMMGLLLLLLNDARRLATLFTSGVSMVAPKLERVLARSGLWGVTSGVATGGSETELAPKDTRLYSDGFLAIGGDDPWTTLESLLEFGMGDLVLDDADGKEPDGTTFLGDFLLLVMTTGGLSKSPSS